MVKFFFNGACALIAKAPLATLFCLFWMIFASLHGEIKIQAEADKNDHFEGATIPITIIVTHPAADRVDEKSFILGKDPIKVEKVKDVGGEDGAEDMLTIYHYDLPARKKGLHALASVSAKVGSSVYRSIATTFEVKARDTGAETPLVSSTSSGAFLKLENIVQGSQTLYPGEKIVVGYRYSFNANIETTEEVTPLFEPKGFLKIGDKIVKNSENSNTTVLEVTQELEAKEPGTYQIGPSSVEGYVYTENASGQRVYSKSPLKSIAPVVVIEVKAIPEEKKPASYTGAVGKYTMTASLKSPNALFAGDEMTLQIEISGSGNLDTLTLPELCCQPGMSGFFKLSDLPPVGQVQGNTKLFTVKMRALSGAATAIPSLEFSFFNPETKHYETARSVKIPITVTDVKATKVDEPTSDKGLEEKETTELLSVEPIEIGGNYRLEKGDLRELYFGTWWMLLIVPLGIGLLIYQARLKAFIDAKKAFSPSLTSTVIYQEAWGEKPLSSEFFNKLYLAFFTRLYERGDVNEVVESIEKLPQSGLSGEVKTLLTALEKSRYSQEKGDLDRERQLLESARLLFKQLVHSKD